ncbi:hypothetical protein [Azospirillum sp. SYSU D00513]|uniref:hypothetical protein n=1 Tax=Azospirillum sp. SYSU D00513 TaxID=2812561 RepID=UPI001A975AF1|nr:hypothetical protein [Azospirillum sp. SYSU D00513]
MDLVEKLPAMTDVALSNLQDNATRLSKSGTVKQKAAAEALLPAVQAEITSRIVPKPVRAPRAKKKAP